ncbi:hypothetical protein V1524DRAFT_479450 [Lipomyces starkeyi]
MEKAVLVKRPQETRQAQSKGCLKRAVRKATLAARFAAKHGLPDPPPAAAPPPSRADATHPAVRDDGRRRQPPRVDGDAYVARTRFRTGDAFPSPSDAGAYDRRQLLTPWGLKYCSNCNRLWCRDYLIMRECTNPDRHSSRVARAGTLNLIMRQARGSMLSWDRLALVKSRFLKKRHHKFHIADSISF